jgi:hypothetical protein
LKPGKKVQFLDCANMPDTNIVIKGISLNLDQYNTLVAAMPLIEAALAEKKATAVRPDYDAAPAAATTSKGEDVENIPEESPAKEVEEEEEDGDEEQDE